ncbi:MAG: aminotransferase class I/II-fold pyridoxal phosphate-dependent enzyme [Kiritimatiellae bacterium]|nr:aminotransferase class I/II-fold pyridoxal phosphate-dependent enzyme [Kiritimatiellia bacterium]
MNDSKSHPDFIASHIRDVPRSGIRDFFEIVSTRKDVISLSIGEPDFVTPWHIRESAIFALEHGATSYTENSGILKLRQDLAEYVSKSFDVAYDPHTEILVTVGVSEALDLAIRAVIEPGDEVIYHEPCYVSYSPVITFARGKPVPVITRVEDDFRLTRKMLEEKITDKTKVLILNFPTNPTGAVLLRKDLEDIADLVIEHNLLVITDEIYSELTYDAERISIATIPGMKERTIFLNGFSKAWAMTGFRIGFSCAPPQLTEAMMKIHQYTMMCAPVLSQKAAIEALKTGDSDKAMMRSEYEKRRNFVCSSFREMGVPCPTPQGAFYVFPFIGDYGMTSQEFSLRLIDEEKVACVPGTAFGPSCEGFIRCSYATGMEDLKQAMPRCASFMKRLQKP